MNKKAFRIIGLKTLTILFLLLAATILVLSFYKQFYIYHLELPVGCDEFGYLYLARTFSQGQPFSSPTQRPFDPGLIKALRASPLRFNSYMHMICPHAYHLDSSTNKIINQYAPGTPLLLSTLPYRLAKRWGPPLFALFILVCLFLGFILDQGRLSFFNISLAILVMFFLLMMTPFRTSFEDINSVAPTFGLLIGAGFLLEKKPGASLAFLGLITAFRIINAILVLPCLLIYIWHKSRGRLLSKTAFGRAIQGSLLFFIGGLWIYAGYVWILLGNPLRSTYSFIDQAFTVKGFLSNVAYYFNLDQKWFIWHLILLTLMTFVTILLKRPWKWVMIALGLTVFNYLYYFFHRVQIGYYPYATALILLGMILSAVVPRMRASRVAWLVPAAGVLVLLFLARSTTHRFPSQDFKQPFMEKINSYVECFSKYDVVWAEKRSGTVEYATGKAGFRYVWGPKKARQTVIRWLRVRGYKQAIWISDLPVSQKAVEEELQQYGFHYEIVSSPSFGNIIEIPPKTPLQGKKPKPVFLSDSSESEERH